MLTKKQRDAIWDAWIYLDNYAQDSELGTKAADKLRTILDENKVKARSKRIKKNAKAS